MCNPFDDLYDDLGERLERLDGVDIAMLSPHQSSDLHWFMSGWAGDEYDADSLATGVYDRVCRVLAKFCLDIGGELDDFSAVIEDDDCIAFGVYLY